MAQEADGIHCRLSEIFNKDGYIYESNSNIIHCDPLCHIMIGTDRV